MWRFIILPYLFLWISVSAFSQDRPQDLKLREAIALYGQAEVEMQRPGTAAMDLLTRNASVSSARGKSITLTISPLTLDWFILQNYDYTLKDRPDAKGLVTAPSLSQAMEWETYPSYSQYDSIMRSFKSTYPSICRLDTIGTSINGLLVLALKISDNPAVNETEPEVFYSSTIHGDETGGFVLMLRLCDYLLRNYGTDSRVAAMVDNLEIWINPLANPDGTYPTGTTITYPTRANAVGKDLNRNFPDPLDPNIVPPKENIDMMKFMRKHRFVISANFHAGSEVVNYPWDRWLSKFHADDAWFYHISRAYADTVHNYSSPLYMNYLDNGVTRGSEWYIIYGGRQDFITWELQGREVTIELDFTKQTPAAQLGLLWDNNYRSLLGYLENAMYGIHGQVIDSESSLPVPARIFISGYDKDSSHVYSDTLSGTFTRMLMPGTWNLSFSAAGYRDTLISNVVVTDRQKTDLIVEMKPISTNIDSVEPVSPVLYPVPAKGSLFCKLPENICGHLHISIYNQSGMKVAEYDREAIFGYPVEISVMNLSGGTYTILFKNAGTGTTYRSRFVTAVRNP